MWRSASAENGATLSTSCRRVKGPVRFPSSARYHWTPSSGTAGGGAGGRAAGADGGRPSGIAAREADDPRVGTAVEGARRGVPAAASSRTVMTLVQALQRTLRIFPRTFSSAMEYLVWQRSQTNFMQLSASCAPGRKASNRRRKLSSKRQEYHRSDPERDDRGDENPAPFGVGVCLGGVTAVQRLHRSRRLPANGRARHHRGGRDSGGRRSGRDLRGRF